MAKKISNERLKEIEMPKPPKGEKGIPIAAPEDITPHSVTIPIHDSHMKHAIPGSEVTMHVRGKVVGTRVKSNYDPNMVTIQPTATGITPSDGKNPFASLAEDES